MLEYAANLLLGDDPVRRLRVERYLYALAVYIFCAALQFSAVAVGLANLASASALFVLILLGQTAFYIAIRTGWSNRFKDPALTMAQMAFANVIIGLSYLVNPQGHSMMSMLMALVLAFSAFVLTPENCRRLGWVCVATLAGALVVAADSWHSAIAPNIDAYHFLLSMAVLLTMGHLMGQLSGLRLRLKAQKQELRTALETVRQLATFDELTGLSNRRHALELMELEARKSVRSNRTFCLSLIDVDHFKHINDTLGHPSGDTTLRLFAALLRGGLRPGDLLARWGGEEFLVLLPETPLEEAACVMERLRERCADPASWIDQPQLRITFSAGLAVHKTGEPTHAVVAQADSALYRAKDAGRNRIEITQ